MEISGNSLDELLKELPQKPRENPERNCWKDSPKKHKRRIPAQFLGETMEEIPGTTLGFLKIILEEPRKELFIGANTKTKPLHGNLGELKKAIKNSDKLPGKNKISRQIPE